MKAEDTVMSEEGFKEVVHSRGVGYKYLCEAQAEISFKAGYKQGVEDANKCGRIDRQLGIKEVVDWLRWHGGLMEWLIMHHEEEWQSQLKEWGL